MEDKVIVVDQNGHEIGLIEKNTAHQTGILHRSFGVFIINSQGNMLIHKRAQTKDHCSGLWSHACSSHPKPGENTKQAAQRRLKEEMGIVCDLQEAFPFIYQGESNNRSCDHGYMHLFIGISDQEPIPNPEEFEAYKWIELHELLKDVNEHPGKYTHWFTLVIEGVALYIKNFLATKNLPQHSPHHPTQSL